MGESREFSRPHPDKQLLTGATHCLARHTEAYISLLNFAALAETVRASLVAA